MARNFMLLTALVLLGVGCASSPEYGTESSPLIREIESESDVKDLEQKIKEENRRARENEEEPIFSYDEEGVPE